MSKYVLFLREMEEKVLSNPEEEPNDPEEGKLKAILKENVLALNKEDKIRLLKIFARLKKRAKLNAEQENMKKETSFDNYLKNIAQKNMLISKLKQDKFSKDLGLLQQFYGKTA